MGIMGFTFTSMVTCPWDVKAWEITTILVKHIVTEAFMTTIDTVEILAMSSLAVGVSTM
jgi:hypothetical protein